MPRIHRLASALALALAASGAAQAQQFSNVVTFGDSLSDPGQYNIPSVTAGSAIAPLTPFLGSFTTNPDPVAAQLLAAYYLGVDANSGAAGSYLLGGSNFAYGGAPTLLATTAGNFEVCVPTSLPCRDMTWQINTHLTASGGNADGHALYQVWGGANDIFANFGAFGAGAFGNPTTAAAQGALIGRAVAAAGREVGLINNLQTHGANYIVVYNLPDIGASPEFRTQGSTAQLVTTVVVNFNNALNAGLDGREGIIAINTFGLVNEVIADVTAGHSSFGITNVTDRACNLAILPVASSFACTTSTLVTAGANNTYLFADGVHPTGAGHRLLADVVIATIAAPSVVALAPEVPLKAYLEHSRAVGESLQSLWGDELEAGTVRGYASIQSGNQDIQADDYSPGLDGNYSSLALGANFRMNDAYTFGAAISVGTQDADTGSIGRIEGVSIIGSLYAQYQNNGLYVRGMLGGGSSSLDITRNVHIGPLLRQQIGKPGARQVAVSGEVGYMFESESLQHGPFFSYAWQELDIETYREEGTYSTAMNFSEFERKSKLTSLGYQIQGSIGSEGNTFQPFARVAWISETQDDQTFVNAGSNSMNGRFTLGGVTPSGEWIDASIGVSAEFGDDLSAFVSLNGHVSDDEQEGGDFSLGVRKTF